jgi:hypothetical protein
VVVLCSSYEIVSGEYWVDLPYNSFGIGFGIPYGSSFVLPGVNFETNVSDSVTIGFGLGYADPINVLVGYACRMNYYVSSREKTFQPRISVIYGVNRVIYVNPGHSSISYESKIGINWGIGAKCMFGEEKKNGFDFDIIFLVTPTPYEVKNEYRNRGYNVNAEEVVRFSFGYRLDF